MHVFCPMTSVLGTVYHSTRSCLPGTDKEQRVHEKQKTTYRNPKVKRSLTPTISFSLFAQQWYLTPITATSTLCFPLAINTLRKKHKIMLFLDPVMSCTIQCSSSRFLYMQSYTLATQRACQEHRTSDLLLSMCTSHMVLKWLKFEKRWST